MQRILAVDVSYTTSRVKVLERLPGNPIGITYRWVDETAVALMSRLPSFARGRPARRTRVPNRTAALAVSRPRYQAYFRDGSGDSTTPERELARSGFFQSGFHVSLIGEPVALARSDDQVPIEQVTDTPSMEDYLEAYVGGWDRRIRSRPVQGQCHAVAEPSRMVALSWPCKWPTRCCRHPVCRGPHRLSRRCGDPSILPPTRLSLCAAMAPNP